MCQVNVYRIDADQNKTLLARKIAHIYQDDAELVLTDVTGDEARVPGMILGADLLRAVVYIGDPALARGIDVNNVNGVNAEG